MLRFAVFRILSPLLHEDLARGYYARTGIVSTADEVAPAKGTTYVDLDSGRVIVGGRAVPAPDLFTALRFRVPADLQGRHTVAFRIGMAGLVSRVLAAVLPNSDPFVINDETLVLSNLSRGDIVTILVEALAVLGEINARRDPAVLAGDDGVGIERVFTGLTIHA
jgi:hypothetical protein